MNHPQLIVCMGVSGAGKTTLARSLSRELAWPCVEADEFHSSENRQRMARGVPLEDRHRTPWMTAVCTHLQGLFQEGVSCVLAHSGLRRRHRQQLRSGGHETRFLELAGPATLIEQRMAHRAGHYMPASLLSSQLTTLQPTDGEPDVYRLNIDRPVDRLVRDSLDVLAPFLYEASTT